MAEMTIEQQRALALAQARRRRAEAEAGEGQETASSPSPFAASMQQQIQPSAEPSSKLERFGTGLKDPFVGVGQLGAHAADALGISEAVHGQKLGPIWDEYVRNRERSVAAGEKAAGVSGVDVPRLAGSLISSAPTALLAPEAPVTAAALGSAVNPTTNENFGIGKAEQTALGAGAGMLGNALASSIKPMVDPVKKAMLEAGVNLSPGQFFGEIGQEAEKAASKLPIVGKRIADVHQKVIDSFNVATINKALEPLGVKVEADTGREAIKKGQDILNDAYDNALVRVPAFVKDASFQNAAKAVKPFRDALGENERRQFDNIIDRTVMQKFKPNEEKFWRTDPKTGNGYWEVVEKAPSMPNKEYKAAESDLRKEAEAWKKDPMASNRDVGRALDASLRALRQSLEDQNPLLSGQLKEINAAYSMFTDAEAAASRNPTTKGSFTPEDLLRTIKRDDTSARDRKFAVQEASPLQGWAENAYDVIQPPKEPSPWGYLNPLNWIAGAAMVPIASMAESQSGMNLLKNFATIAPKTRNMLAAGTKVGASGAGPAAGILANPPPTSPYQP